MPRLGFQKQVESKVARLWPGAKLRYKMENGHAQWWVDGSPQVIAAKRLIDLNDAIDLVANGTSRSMEKRLALQKRDIQHPIRRAVTKTVAQQIGVTEGCVLRWVRECGCPHAQAGPRSHIRYNVAEVKEWLARWRLQAKNQGPKRGQGRKPKPRVTTGAGAGFTVNLPDGVARRIKAVVDRHRIVGYSLKQFFTDAIANHLEKLEGNK